MCCGVARDLTDLDKQLDGINLRAQALDAQQTVVNVVERIHADASGPAGLRDHARGGPS
jgi:hypothetical protein